MSEANFVAEVNPNIKDTDPSCHVCGAVMVAQGICQLDPRPHSKQGDGFLFGACPDWKFVNWKCLSCGANTGCS